MDLLNPCDQCPKFTTNAARPNGVRLCSGCLDNLAFVRTADVDDLRVIAAEGVRP